MKITTDQLNGCEFRFYFWVLLAFLTVKHGYIHFAMNGIYNKISTIYPRKREYRPIKIFHLNFANCFGLLFHNILVGFIWNWATKSAGCVFTVYHIYVLSLYGETVIDRMIFRVFHLFLSFILRICVYVIQNASVGFITQFAICAHPLPFKYKMLHTNLMTNVMTVEICNAKTATLLQIF